MMTSCAIWSHAAQSFASFTVGAAGRPWRMRLASTAVRVRTIPSDPADRASPSSHISGVGCWNLNPLAMSGSRSLPLLRACWLLRWKKDPPLEEIFMPISEAVMFLITFAPFWTLVMSMSPWSASASLMPSR